MIQNFTMYDMICRNADWYADAVAFVHGGRRTTFGDFRRLCDRCAAGLATAGVAAGDRIALLSANGTDFMVVLGAAAKIGAVVVPINTRLGEAETAFVLQDTAPVCLIRTAEYREAGSRAAETIRSIQMHYVIGEDAAPGGAVPFGTLLAHADGSGPERDAEAPSDQAPFLIIHTAAVGGRARGAVLTQANLLAGGLQITDLLRIVTRDCHLCLLPLFHIGGLAMTVAAMLAGCKTVLMERFDAAGVPGIAAGEKVSFFVTFPPMLAAILDAAEKAGPALPDLRAVSGVDSPETIDRFLRTHPRAAFFSLYGQTEAMPVSGCDYRTHPGSIGRPAMLTRLTLRDDLDRPVPAGKTAEICLRSPAVFRGYWNLPEETARTLRNGWHHTGDLGRLDAEGFLWYAGRKPEKELIKPGGENVYPAEVEKAILQHEAIAEVCVIGVPDAQWGEAVKAVCVRRPGATVGAEELIAFVSARIARYKKPKYIVFTEELPKTASGDIDRARVKKHFAAP